MTGDGTKFDIGRRVLLKHVMLICGMLFYQFLVAMSEGSPSGARKGGGSSVFSLFNLKEKSRFWSENVIRGGKHDFDWLSSKFNFPSYYNNLRIYMFHLYGRLGQCADFDDLETSSPGRMSVFNYTKAGNYVVSFSISQVTLIIILKFVTRTLVIIFV